MQTHAKGTKAGLTSTPKVTQLKTPELSRRGFVMGTAAGAATLAGAMGTRRRTMAKQSLEGEVGVRFFPFGTGVEELYQSFADEFQSENPGVEIRLDLQPWSNRYPKMLADLAAGQGPDVMFVTTDVLIRFSEAGVIEPLGDRLSSEAWEGYPEDVIDEISYEDARWFAPMDQEVPVWLTNKAIFEQAGLDPENPPGTWDEIREVCRQVKDVGDANLFGWGYNAASATLNTTFYPFLYQAGGRPISDDGSEPTFNSEEGVAALEFIVELFEENWASDQYLQPIEDGQNPFFLGSQAISIEEFAADIIDIRQNAPDLDYGLTPMLSNEETWGFGGMRSWAMSSTAQNKDAAAAFMEFLLQPEIMARHAEAFGVFPRKEQAMGMVYQDDPELSGLSDRLPNVFGEQKHKYGRDLMPLVIPEIQAAILGEKSAKDALDDAARAVQELFNQG